MAERYDDSMDGVSADELMRDGKSGISFSDFTILPGFINFGVDNVDLATRLTQNITLKAPLISSPLDTVTEAAMAITMAQHGGIGFVHSNFATHEQQAAQVRMVKKYKHGAVLSPECVHPTWRVADVIENAHKLGFSSLPVTATGRVGGRLLGMVTSREVDLVAPSEWQSVLVSDVMKPRERVIAVREEAYTHDDVLEILKKNKNVGAIPVVDDEGRLMSLVCRADFKKPANYALATKDARGALRVGAALSSHPLSLAAIPLLVDAGIDVILLDSTNGSSRDQVELLKWIKAQFPTLDVIAGNVVTAQQARVLLDAGADALRVGFPREGMAAGRAHCASIHAVASVARERGIATIASGGIRNVGCISKALAIGVSAVIIDSLLAASTEAPLPSSPSAPRTFVAERAPVKRSNDAFPSQGHNSEHKEGSVRVEHRVVFGTTRGSAHKLLSYLIRGLQYSLQDMGVSSLSELHSQSASGKLRFERRSPNAQAEGAVHSVHSLD